MSENTKIQELALDLSRAKKELADLKVKYNADILYMRKEISYLKEQIMAQQTMLSNAIEYTNKLEKQFEDLKNDIRSDDAFQSIH